MTCTKCGSSTRPVGNRLAKGVEYKVYQCPECLNVQYEEKTG